MVLLDVVDDQVVGRRQLVELAGQRGPLGGSTVSISAFFSLPTTK